jgi:hypothetical protein
MSNRVRELPIVMWAVFFLVTTGRGASLEKSAPTNVKRS